MTVLIGDATLIWSNHIAGKVLNSTICRRFSSIAMQIKSPWQFALVGSMRVLLLVHSVWQIMCWWIHKLLFDEQMYVWSKKKKNKKKNFVNDSLSDFEISCDNIILQISKGIFCYKIIYNSICIVLSYKTTIYLR